MVLVISYAPFVGCYYFLEVWCYLLLFAGGLLFFLAVIVLVEQNTRAQGECASHEC